MNALLVALSIRLIVWYQRRLSTSTRSTCLHFPTCSEYAVLALQRHGFATGWRMALRRVADCAPGSGRAFIDLPLDPEA